MYLLDSNTCIQFLNGRSASIERRLIKLCSVVKAEMCYGAVRSNDAAAVMSKLTAFFAPYESLPFDDAAAVEYGSIRGQLATVGTPIGPNDLMIAAIAAIAAIARGRGLTLVTHNTREFSRIPGLSIEDWE
jgi:tRNA(fMet)-specific endonuclease VapC